MRRASERALVLSVDAPLRGITRLHFLGKRMVLVVFFLISVFQDTH